MRSIVCMRVPTSQLSFAFLPAAPASFRGYQDCIQTPKNQPLQPGLVLAPFGWAPYVGNGRTSKQMNRAIWFRSGIGLEIREVCAQRGRHSTFTADAFAAGDQMQDFPNPFYNDPGRHRRSWTPSMAFQTMVSQSLTLQTRGKPRSAGNVMKR